MANRVCTTDCSSTSGSMITWSAILVNGVSGVATIAVPAVPLAASELINSTTSVVVPDRLIASTASYRRPAGNSLGGNASVSPWPERSRSAAYARAMNSEVPQPTTATRRPGCGRPSTRSARTTIAAQSSGCPNVSRSRSVVAVALIRVRMARRARKSPSQEIRERNGRSTPTLDDMAAVRRFVRPRPVTGRGDLAVGS